MSPEFSRGDGREFWISPQTSKRSRRIEVTPGYAKLLAGDLDCEGYAASLVRPRRQTWRALKRRRRGPIAMAAEEARQAELGPRIMVRSTPVTPEYRRFLRAEITSSEYAAAIAAYARLEQAYRAPSAPFSFRRPNSYESALDYLRLLFSLSGALLVAGVLVPLIVALLAKTAVVAMNSAWTVSLVGAFLLAVTLAAASWSLILGWLPPFHRRGSEGLEQG